MSQILKINSAGGTQVEPGNPHEESPSGDSSAGAEYLQAPNSSAPTTTNKQTNTITDKTTDTTNKAVGDLAALFEDAARIRTTGESASEGSLRLTTGAEESDSSEDGNVTVLVGPSAANKDVEDEAGKGLAKKKKLSGAQRKKLRKMRLTAEKVAPQETPKGASEPTPVPTGKRIRSPQEESAEAATKKRKSFLTSGKTKSSNLKPNEVSKQNSGGSKKEGRSLTTKSDNLPSTSGKGDLSKVRPSLKRKATVESGKKPPSYAKVAKKQQREELCFGVIDSKNATGKIPEEHRPAIEELVNTKIMEHVLDKGDECDEIQILSCSYARGILMLQLASNKCVSTLARLVKDVPTPWEGGKLDLVRKRDIPELTKASFFLKGWGSKLPPRKVLDVLGNQNKGLQTGKWEIFHREENQGGTLFVVGIDNESLEKLKEMKGRAFFVSTAVYIKIGKVPIGRTAGKDDAAKEGATKEGSEAAAAPQQAEEEAGDTITSSQEDRLLA